MKIQLSNMCQQVNINMYAKSCKQRELTYRYIYIYFMKTEFKEMSCTIACNAVIELPR